MERCTIILFLFMCISLRNANTCEQQNRTLLEGKFKQRIAFGGFKDKTIIDHYISNKSTMCWSWLRKLFAEWLCCCCPNRCCKPYVEYTTIKNDFAKDIYVRVDAEKSYNNEEGMSAAISTAGAIAGSPNVDLTRNVSHRKIEPGFAIIKPKKQQTFYPEANYGDTVFITIKDETTTHVENLQKPPGQGYVFDKAGHLKDMNIDPINSRKQSNRVNPEIAVPN